MARSRELYGYNIYSDGVLVAVADTRDRARKLARQLGGTYRHVHTAAPRSQHARGGVGAYRSNPETDTHWTIEHKRNGAWRRVPVAVFSTPDDAESEVLELIAEGLSNGARLSESDFRIVEGARNPTFPRITYIVAIDAGRKEKWAVRRDDAKRASKRFKRKAEALDYARDKALDHRYSQIVIYGRDGEVADVKYYGALGKSESRLGIDEY